MLGIIKKDFLLLKIQTIIFILVSGFFIAAYLFIKVIVFKSEITDTSFSRTALSLIPLLFAIEFNTKNFQYDHDNKGSEKYFNSLPISRTEMVIGKFMGSLLFTLIGYVMSVIAMALFCYTDNVSLSLSSLKIQTVFLFVTIIMLGIQLPILVYNGNTMISSLTSMAILLLPVVIYIFAKGMDVNELITDVTNYFNKHNNIKKHIVSITFTISALVTSVLIAISTFVYKRREF